MATSTTTNLSELMATYYDKKLLTRLVPQLVLYQFGLKKKIPKGAGKSIVWSIYTELPAATTALTEGTTPDSRTLSATNVSATVSPYGDNAIITDFVSVTAIDSVLESKADGVFADQAALTVDTLVRNVLSAGTEQLARGKAAVSDLQTSDTLIASEIRKAVRTLEYNKAKPHRMTPGFYPTVVAPFTKYDLIGDTATGSWVDVRKYVESRQKEIEMNKVGDLYGAKIYMSQNIQEISAVGYGANTYNNLMIGDEAFGVTDIVGLDGASMIDIIVKQLGSSGSADPHNQRGSIAWTIYFATKILNAKALMVIKTGATA